MDLGLLARVIWRFKHLAAAGFALAIVLAVLSTASVSFPGGRLTLTYRNPVIYTAQARILATQSGFPWGRTVLPASPQSPVPNTRNPGYADPSRFSTLATFYAQLVNGDQIQRQVVRPQLKQLLFGAVEIDHTNNEALPFVDITSFAPSPVVARRLAENGTRALQSLVSAQQTKANIPDDQRVLLQVLQQPTKVRVAEPRKKTIPIVVFMTVLIATLGALLALENLRPGVAPAGVRPVSRAKPKPDEATVGASRRTA
jgi:hypothetical protein